MANSCTFYSANHLYYLVLGCVKNDPNGPLKPLSANGKPAPALPFKSVHPLFMAGAGYVISGEENISNFLQKCQQLIFIINFRRSHNPTL